MNVSAKLINNSVFLLFYLTKYLIVTKQEIKKST